MPRAWSEQEKAMIRATLQREGRKLFEKYGLQKTTIDEIVQAARISKGAFYVFYPSKEELYFDILEALETEFRNKLFADLSQPGLGKKERFQTFLRQFLDLLVSVPIYAQLKTSDYQYLMRKLPREKVEKHMQRDLSDLSHYFEQWIEQGWLKKVELAALQGLFLSLFYFVIHRDDYSDIDFQQTKELWIDMISDYLVTEE